MSQDEVSYVKGVPTHVLVDEEPSKTLQQIEVSKLDQGQNVSDFSFWGYDISGAWIRVDLDADRRIKSILCYSNGYFDCPAVFGLYDGSDEERVIARLGQPTSVVCFTRRSPDARAPGEINRLLSRLHRQTG